MLVGTVFDGYGFSLEAGRTNGVYRTGRDRACDLRAPALAGKTRRFRWDADSQVLSDPRLNGIEARVAVEPATAKSIGR